MTPEQRAVRILERLIERMRAPHTTVADAFRDLGTDIANEIREAVEEECCKITGVLTDH